MFDNHHNLLRPMETLNPNPKVRIKNEFDYECSLMRKMCWDPEKLTFQILLPALKTFKLFGLV
jgi:hypothetical protein